MDPMPRRAQAKRRGFLTSSSLRYMALIIIELAQKLLQFISLWSNVALIILNHDHRITGDTLTLATAMVAIVILPCLLTMPIQEYSLLQPIIYCLFFALYLSTAIRLQIFYLMCPPFVSYPRAADVIVLSNFTLYAMLTTFHFPFIIGFVCRLLIKKGLSEPTKW